jgi:glutaredoxin 3
VDFRRVFRRWQLRAKIVTRGGDELNSVFFRYSVLMETTVIYTKNGCPYCAAAMSDMRKNGEKFTELNCSIEPAHIKDLMRISNGRLVPVIVRGSDVQIGYGGG